MQPDSNDFKMTKYVLNTNLRYIGNMQSIWKSK